MTTRSLLVAPPSQAASRKRCVARAHMCARHEHRLRQQQQQLFVQQRRLLHPKLVLSSGGSVLSPFSSLYLRLPLASLFFLVRLHKPTQQQTISILHITPWARATAATRSRGLLSGNISLPQSWCHLRCSPRVRIRSTTWPTSLQEDCPLRAATEVGCLHFSRSLCPWALFP
jgi:hypothetical protein